MSNERAHALAPATSLMCFRPGGPQDENSHQVDEETGCSAHVDHDGSVGVRCENSLSYFVFIYFFKYFREDDDE